MSSITYHYGGKEGLYLAAADHIAATMATDMGPVLADCSVISSDAGEARGCIHRMLDRFAEKMMAQDREGWSLFIMREQMKPGAAFDRFYDGAMGQMMERLAREVAVATGMGDTLDARIATVTLFGQVIAFRAARALALRITRRDTLDAEVGAALRARIAANTDAILDRMTAERRGPQ